MHRLGSIGFSEEIFGSFETPNLSFGMLNYVCLFRIWIVCTEFHIRRSESILCVCVLISAHFDSRWLFPLTFFDAIRKCSCATASVAFSLSLWWISLPKKFLISWHIHNINTTGTVIFKSIMQLSLLRFYKHIYMKWKYVHKDAIYTILQWQVLFPLYFNPLKRNSPWCCVDEHWFKCVVSLFLSYDLCTSYGRYIHIGCSFTPSLFVVYLLVSLPLSISMICAMLYTHAHILRF